MHPFETLLPDYDSSSKSVPPYLSGGRPFGGAANLVTCYRPLSGGFLLKCLVSLSTFTRKLARS